MWQLIDAEKLSFGKKEDITNWQEMSSACYHTSQDHSPESEELSLMQMKFGAQHAPYDETEQKYVHMHNMDFTTQYAYV